ncbi:MAG: ABC transporter permease [Candidatus Dormibacteria bacterium]|jgi:ABC-2 type transport system permease protein
MSTIADAQLDALAAGPGPQLNTFRHYRHLTVELAISQFKLRYTQSVLGYFWSLLKPAMIFAITFVIFVGLFKIKDGTQFYGIQLLLGIVVWTFFAECTASSMMAIAGSAGLIRKAYFPRSILVIAASMSSLFTFLINLTIVFVIAVLLHQIDVGFRIFLVIPLLLELYLLAIGISLFLSALFVQFHDIGHLWDVLMQLLFYGSGVMFSLSYVLQRAHLALAAGQTLLPGQKLAVGAKLLGGATVLPTSNLWAVLMVACNPIMQTIEDLRHALLTPQAPWTELVVTGHLAAVNQYARFDYPWLLPVPFLVVVAVLTIGALTFRARARTFAENL